MNNARKVTVSPEMLCGIKAFRCLSTLERRAIIERCHSRHYEPGQFIANSGEKQSDVYFIITGKVQVAVCSESGQQITLEELAAGQMFGELAAIDGVSRSADVKALTEVLIASISAHDYWTLMLRYPSIAESTLGRLSQMIRLLCTRVVQVSSQSSRCRLQSELLNRSLPLSGDPNKAIISPAPKHGDLADFIGVRRETVTRLLSRLRRAGLVEKRDRDLVILDVTGLETALTDECAC